MSTVRSILAVVGGFLTMAVLVAVLTGVAVKRLKVNPGEPTPLYLSLNVAYSLLAAAAGGSVTARIASHHPVQHAVALAVLMAAMSVVSFFQSRGMQPLWYQALLGVLPPLCAIAGATLFARN